MFTRKPRWLSCGNAVINLDRVDVFIGVDGGTNVFSGGREKQLFIKGMAIDDMRHYLKHGKLKRR